MLGGGLQRRRLYLSRACPGSGKTTLALQFLLAAARAGRRCSTSRCRRRRRNSQRRRLARLVARQDDVRELMPTEGVLDPDEQSTMFHPSEIELAATTRPILADVDRIKPSCIVFDSLSELRLLAGSALRYRRQILALKQFFAGTRVHGHAARRHDGVGPTCRSRASPTAWSCSSSSTPSTAPTGGGCASSSTAAMAFRGGYHDYIIRRGGLHVFPRLVAAEHRQEVQRARSCRARSPHSTSCSAADRAGHEHADRGRRRHRQVHARGPVRRGGGAPRADGGHVHRSTRAPATLLTRADRAEHSAGRGRQRGPGHDSAGRSRRAVAGRVHPRASARGRGARRRASSSSTASTATSMRCRSERFLAIQLHELLDLPGPARRRHHPGERAPGTAGRADDRHRGRQLSGRRGHPDALLRDARRDRQAVSVVKKRGGRARAHDPRVQARRRVHPGRRGARDFSGVLTGVPMYEGAGGTCAPRSHDD